MGFKENLKAELNFQNVLVKELAAKTKISKRTLDNYLRTNANDPPATTAVRIAKALGVSVEYLVTGRERKPKKSFEKCNADIIARELKKLSKQECCVVLDLINSMCTNLH